MRRIHVIFVSVLFVGLFLSVSAYSASRVRNKALLDIVPSEQALLAVTVRAPLCLRVSAPQTDVAADLGSSPQVFSLESSGKVEIKNNTPFDIEIEQITCTNIGLGRSVKVSFAPVIKSGQSQAAEIDCGGDKEDLSNLNALKLQLKANWAGGKAAVEFDLPLERIQAPANTPSEAGSVLTETGNTLGQPD